MTDDDTDEQPAGLRVHRSLEHFDAPGEVTREEQDDGSVRYGNLLMLAPGEWTDAASEETLFYSPEMTTRLAEDPDGHVVDDTVNVDHQHRDQLLQVGSFDRESLQTDDDGNLYGDVVLWNDTQASEDAVALMDRALKSDGEAGAGGLSVEIPMEGEVVEWDSDRGMNKMVEADLSGLAIVTDAASEPASFETQFAERSVAMQDGDTAAVRVMQATDGGGRTALTGEGPGSDMTSPIESLDELRDRNHEDATLLTTADGEHAYLLDDAGAVSIEIDGESIDDIQDALNGDGDDGEREEESGMELQGEDELQTVAGLIGEYEEAVGDMDAPATAFVEFVETETETAPDDIQAVLEAYLNDVGAESLEETPVSALQGYVDGELEDNPDDEEEEAPDGGEDEDRENERVEELESELSEVRQELEKYEDLDDRLRQLEEEPAEADTLAETAGRGGDGEERGPPAASSSPIAERHGYLGR